MVRSLASSWSPRREAQRQANCRCNCDKYIDRSLCVVEGFVYKVAQGREKNLDCVSRHIYFWTPYLQKWGQCLPVFVIIESNVGKALNIVSSTLLELSKL